MGRMMRMGGKKIKVMIIPGANARQLAFSKCCSILNQSFVLDAGMMQLHQAYHQARMCELRQKYKEVRDQCEAVKKRGEEIKKVTMERQSQEGLGWWEVPIGDLNRNELQELRLKLEELKKNITDELASRASAPTAFSADSIA